MNDLGAIPIPPEAAEAFFRQQESLHADHIRSIARGRRAAWWIAGSAVAVAVLEAAAIASLAPIHDVEWRLVPLVIDSERFLQIDDPLVERGTIRCLRDRLRSRDMW